MNPMTLEQIARLCGGRLVQGSGLRQATRVHTDSRSAQPGDCFVALVGETHDGHAHVADAVRAGAVAAIVSRKLEGGLPESLGVIEVADTLVALQQLAREYRRQLKTRVVAVTGSSGKTSTKELIAAVLSQAGKTRATAGNLNNHIGVPLTLLSLDPEDAWAVVEMGMNHPGEIAPLAALAAPEIGVVTNVGTAHIEFFGTTEAIGLEKSELIAALPADGVAVLNADDANSRALAQRTQARVVWAGESASAQWRAKAVQVDARGVSFELLGPGTQSGPRVQLPTPARVQVNNALLAASVGGAAGLTPEQIARGLGSARAPHQRMEILKWRSGFILNDSYNANAESMRAALQALADFPAPARRVAVLGSMGELGQQARELHEQVGRLAAESGAQLLLFLGPHAEALRTGALKAENPAEQCLTGSDAVHGAQLALPLLRNDDTVLVKGSRFMQLEKFIAVLTEKNSTVEAKA